MFKSRYLFIPLFLCSSLPAYANWQYTQWGMNPEQVIEASNGAAILLDETEKKARSGTGDTDNLPLVKAPYSSGQYHYIAYFHFNRNTHQLTSVNLDLQNSDTQSGADILNELHRKFGEPVKKEHKRLMNLITWHTEGDQLTYISILSSIQLNYQPLPPATAAPL